MLIIGTLVQQMQQMQHVAYACMHARSRLSVCLSCLQCAWNSMMILYGCLAGGKRQRFSFRIRSHYYNEPISPEERTRQ